MHRDLPGDVPSLLAAAEAAAQARDFQRSIELLKTASQRAPANVNIFLNLGSMHGKRYDFAGAQNSFEQAVGVAGDKKQALVLAGVRSLRMGNDEMARKYFRRAIDFSDPPITAYLGLAEIHERQNQSKDAADFIERALRQDAQCAPGWLMRARSHRRVGELKEAADILTRLVEKGDGKLAAWAEAGCELGRVLDLQQNYDAAMAAVVKAKASLRPPASVLAGNRKLRGGAQKLEALISAGKLEEWRVPDVPPCRLVLAGGRAYGTEKTLLEQMFNSHPEVLYAEDSRIFLDEVFIPLRDRDSEMPLATFIEGLQPETIREMREIYLRRSQVFLQKPLGNRLLIEKNHVFNSLLLVMTRLFPEAGYLMMVRDPRDACLESFMQLKPMNPCSCEFLTLAGAVDECAATMSHWRTAMAALGNPQLEVKIEQLKSDGESVCRQVLQFLNLNTPNPFPILNSYASDGWSVGNWKNYEKYLKPHLSKLNPLVEAYRY